MSRVLVASLLLVSLACTNAVFTWADAAARAEKAVAERVAGQSVALVRRPTLPPEPPVPRMCGHFINVHRLELEHLILEAVERLPASEWYKHRADVWLPMENPMLATFWACRPDYVDLCFSGVRCDGHFELWFDQPYRVTVYV